jgi:hypothetical protein
VSKPIFGKDGKERQRELCLQYAAELRSNSPSPVVPTAVTKLCFVRSLFTDDQRKRFEFDGARRLVERWMKTRDKTGLETWPQSHSPMRTARCSGSSATE